MIRLERGVLVLDSPISKEDAEAVGEFAKHVREQERERIIKLLHDNIGWCEALEYDYFADDLEQLIKGETK